MSRVRTSAPFASARRAAALLVGALLVGALLVGVLLTAVPAAALPVVLAQPASAAVADPAPDATVTWGVRPADGERHAPGRANFAYAAAPGDVIEDALVVSNHGASDTTLQVYAADAFTTSRGVLDLRRVEEPAAGVGAWTAVATPEVVVPAGGSVVVPFTLSVPADAEPGDHAGGVVTSLVSARADGVSVDRRLGARLHLRVDGPLAPGAALGDVRVTHHGAWNPVATRADVRVEVANTGNVRVDGEATVTVAGPLGWGARTTRVDVPELLPGERTTLAVDVDEVVPVLLLAATVSVVPQVVADGTTLRPVTATASTAAVPWAVLVALLLVAGAVVASRRRARQRAAATERRVAEAVAAARAGT